MSVINNDRSRRFNRKVPPLTTVYDDVVVPNGETWRITRFFGSADFSGETNVAVIWDRDGSNDLLFGTFGTGTQEHADISVTGDDSKVLSIRLANQLTISADLFASYTAVKE